MTDHAEIERLLNQTGRTLEGLPEEHTMAERIDAAHRIKACPTEIICHQSDVIELLVGALRDALKLIEHQEERLINEITRRDNLLAEMGIHLPEDEPMEWEYKHIRGAWRRVSSDGWVICPRCKTVQIRLVGTWYKHCPECGKRLAMRREQHE